MAVLELVGGLALFEGVQAEVAAALGPFLRSAWPGRRRPGG